MSSPDDVEDLDEMDVKIARAEETLIVRGRPQHEWWVELRRLEREGRWTEYEILLLELRDAVELSSKLVGWTVAPAPAKSLARLYLDQGNKKRGGRRAETALGCDHQIPADRADRWGYW